MSGFPVPPVTPQDLRVFHAKHFPWAQPTSGHAFPHDATLVDEYENDDLGYYPDGVKRTLTDEQVEIFRHSEIHALLREKQLKEEALAEKLEESMAEKHDRSQQEESAPDAAEPMAAEEIGPKQAASNNSTIKTQSEIDNTILDYEETDSKRTPRGQPGQSSHFSGRRIISYDD
ncbi:hypothetical protein BDV59DRAFT_147681 [Aspergillus ambiguus]|uniref:DUF3807 domain-containing protein n=1 Tax=Aspergillus ambiguus TaxID=176160 RepID=UPI003CCDB923